jgi:hypothetical protein
MMKQHIQETNGISIYQNNRRNHQPTKSKMQVPYDSYMLLADQQ